MATAWNQPATPSFAPWSRYELCCCNSLLAAPVWWEVDGGTRLQECPCTSSASIWASQKGGLQASGVSTFSFRREGLGSWQPQPLNQSPRPDTICWPFPRPQCPLELWLTNLQKAAALYPEGALEHPPVLCKLLSLLEANATLQAPRA